MDFTTIHEWFIGLGAGYGVNPYIFGGIYVGAIPFFFASVGWMVHNLKKKRSIMPPVFAACCCAISAYVYLMIAGENLPFWVYVVIAGLILAGIYSTLKKVRSKMKEVTHETPV